MAYLIFLPTLFFAVILPGTLVLIRETVKHHRQEVIRDLAAVFQVQDGNVAHRLIPSFEFVKFKYFLGTTDESQNRQPQDFRTLAWFIAIVPFVVIVGSLSWFSFTVLFTGHLPLELRHLQKFEACQLPATGNCSPVPLWAYAVSSAFLGSYLFEIRALYRAINNFDLNPALIVDCTINIATGSAISIIVVLGFDILGFEDITEGLVRTDSAVILLCFAAGYLPQVTVRWIMTKSRLKNFKRENQEIYKLFEATPIELIDGIDTEIRDRLADFHISSTQNLAAANPLMLFVETPYGVYQIMDWVAQAQLCASVGPKSVAGLWKLGVRTLFDLERAALGPLCKNTQMLEAIGAAMFSISPPLSVPPSGNGGPQYDEAFVRANIEMRLDDPHVHRLRQIYMQVGDRIGQKHLRFFVRDGAGTGPVTLNSSTIAFTQPDTIQVADGGLRIFKVADTLKIIGGVNDGKMGTVTSVSDNMLKLINAELETAAGQSGLILLKINP